jgi:hypothetical protein
VIEWFFRYPNGDPEQSGEFLRGESADMGGGDYIKGWVRHPERLHDAYYSTYYVPRHHGADARNDARSQSRSCAKPSA